MHPPRESRYVLGCIFILWLITTSGMLCAQDLTPIETWILSGDIAQPDEISGITMLGANMIVCPDEEASFNLLKRTGPVAFAAERAIELVSDDNAEIDLEGAASDRQFVYLIGSHGLARKAVKATRTYEDNRKALTKVSEHDGADSLFRLQFDADGKLSSKEHITLRGVLESDPLLQPFNKIPSKENGVDIEGIAVKNGRLYLGFRGPVLRDNYAAIMTFKFKQPQEYQLLFVNLDGRGIRDITSVSDGFLIIGGPIGEGQESYELYHWNGKDCIPGADSPGGTVRSLGTLPSTQLLKPEGICILEESPLVWDILVVRDGEKDVKRFQVSKSGQ